MIELAKDGRRAVLTGDDGEHWLTLSLLSSFDREGAVDETVSWETRAEGDAIVLERRSTAWESAGTVLTRHGDRIELRSWVEGEGALTDVHLLGGRSVAGPATGLHLTGTSCTTLFSPNPGDPAKLVRSAAEEAVLGVNGDGELGRGHWFFTPPPLLLGFSRDGGAPWLGLSLEAPIQELTFVQAVHRPGDRAFHLTLAYQGHTHVRGRFEAPVVVLRPGLADPLDALARPSTSRPTPEWWSGAIYCGWGSQVHLSSVGEGPAPALATQENYDRFLAALEAHGVVPPTIVIDDKWQETYGLNRPDRSKWPDLKRWIAERHARGQKVLLWWKGWDPEGLDPDLCIRRPDGVPVALDPSNPATQELLRETMHALCSPEGLDADGLKTDFTARTPSGHALAHHGPAWGIALLHEQLRVVYDAVKEAKGDALVITQTPHPAFGDVTDMVRLNDMLRLDDPGPIPAGAVVPQMRYRAAVARAALPGHLVDTDDWAIPDRATWREYLAEKPDLGVPSLYYATHVGLAGEPLTDDDYAALRALFGGT